MRRTRLLPAALSAIAAAITTSAHAQTDIQPPLPNILILLDTSGSMERMNNSTIPALKLGEISKTIKNRWIEAIEVLGGQIQNYKVLAVDRNSADFANEYSLGNVLPYDSGYFMPHFRPFSNDCTLGATSLSRSKTFTKDPLTWGVSDFGFRRLLSGGTMDGPGSCTPGEIRTDGLGILDTFRDQARFSLMTFDSDPSPLTGVKGGASVNGEGMVGQWSYFPGYLSAAPTPSYGWPRGCGMDPGKLANHEFEEGARNMYAPPWEGPHVPFADNDSTTAMRDVNDRIRNAVWAARPYGATPIAPMLEDAAHYYLNDPKGPAKADPIFACRGSFNILITDGFPNSDLRPECESTTDPDTAAVYPACSTTGSSGCCPSRRAQKTAYDLAHPPAGKPPVKTFVVGFSLSDDTGKAVDCTAVTPESGMCATIPAGDPRKACCSLHEIAYAGGTSRAQIATDADSLRKALVRALAEATATTSTSRTLPVFTSVANASVGKEGQFEFRSSFKVNPFTAWSGELERVRWECVSSAGARTPQALPFDPGKGDDFGANLATSTNRRFFTHNALTSSAKSGDTLRPRLAVADSDGNTPAVGSVVDARGPSFVGAVSAAAMELSGTSCTEVSGASVSADDCKTKYLNYALAQVQPRTDWASRVTLPLGDIYHATPVSVGPPSQFLRDESYTAFRDAQQLRTPMVLTATNDGLLHAFDASADKLANNELWAFVPPAVLPHLAKQYNGAHAKLLDASPVVKDVAFGKTPAYGRSRIAALGGLANWRTVAVGGLTTGRGYYALDITDPAKPAFLWQLTKYQGRELFGSLPGIPAIGTVYVREPGTKEPIETPVAFLPGGEGSLWKSAGTCDRWNVPTSSDPATQVRKSTRCWNGPGLSFTVVRLYDGKILRTFRNNPKGKSGSHPDETVDSPVVEMLNAGASEIVTDTSSGYAEIDSPITGTVGLYPGGTGTVTTRAFVGDQDGTMWRADFTSTDPREWSFGIFHDAYYATDSDNLDPKRWGPVAIAPVLSVDRIGDVVVNFATGDQENFDAINLSYLYSVTEKSVVVGGKKTLEPKVNWRLKLPSGIVPTGPLSLFNSDLYFSTFTPGVKKSADQCLSGQGTLWAVHYLDTEPGTGTPGLPLGRFKRGASEAASVTTGSCPSSDAPFNLFPKPDGRLGYTDFFRCITLEPGSIIFGAGITQRPSCVVGGGAASNDPYIAGGAPHTTINDITPGSYELVAQTGPKAGGGGGGTKTNTFVRSLVTPLAVTRIDSWAAVVE